MSDVTAWVSLTAGTFDEPPTVTVTVERGAAAGPHRTGSAEHAEFGDLDDAILWAAGRSARIVVEVGERLTAGVEPVAPYPRFAGEAAAAARAGVRAAHARYAVERAADADEDEHVWFVAAYDPDLAADADPQDVAHAVAAHGDVVAVHAREDEDGTPVWIVELEADTATAAAVRGFQIMFDAFWPPERRDRHDGAEMPIARGRQDVGLVEYLDERLMELD